MPQLYAKDLMNEKLITLRPEMTCDEAAEVFMANNISGAPVVDERGVLLGVLSLKDVLKSGLEFPYETEFFEEGSLARRFDETGFHIEQCEGFISDYLNRQVHTATPDTPIETLAKLMYERRIHRVIIVSPHEQKPVGVVTSFDLIKALAEYTSVSEVLARGF